MESVLRYVPALFCSLVPKGSFPGDPTDNLPEELEVCLPKVQDPALTPYLTYIPQDCKLHQCVITAAQVTSNTDIPD